MDFTDAYNTATDIITELDASGNHYSSWELMALRNDLIKQLEDLAL